MRVKIFSQVSADIVFADYPNIQIRHGQAILFNDEEDGYTIDLLFFLEKVGEKDQVRIVSMQAPYDPDKHAALYQEITFQQKPVLEFMLTKDNDLLLAQRVFNLSKDEDETVVDVHIPQDNQDTVTTAIASVQELSNTDISKVLH